MLDPNVSRVNGLATIATRCKVLDMKPVLFLLLCCIVGCGSTGGNPNVDGGTDGGEPDGGGPDGGGPDGGTDCGSSTVPSLATVDVAAGYDWTQPLFLTQAPGGDELYVVEQTGAIRVVQSGSVLSTEFLDLSGTVSSGFEDGLLGLAFHPGYAANGRFFVFYTETSGNRQNVVAEYSRGGGNPLVASSTEVRRLIEPVDRDSNHNGGMLAFGPDGFLYVGIGDEGGANDVRRNGQDRTTLFGSILRLDVDAVDDDFAAAGNPFSLPTGLPQIWAFGLRNPWRFSFDRVTNDMFIADVGQRDWEEIDVIPAGTSGQNFGWRGYEGNEVFRAEELPLVTPHVPPIDVTPHSNDPHLGNARSITGGYVYRGSAIPGLQGFYLFADYDTDRVAALKYCEGTAQFRQEVEDLGPNVAGGNGPSSFGEDADGELYILHLDSGQVRKIVPGS